MKLCIPAKGFSICQNQFKAVKGSRRLFSSSLIVKSKIGKQPVKLPSSITVTVSDCQAPKNDPTCDRILTIASAGETLGVPLHPFVEIKQTAEPNGEALLYVTVKDPLKAHERAMWGTTRALAARHVEGFTDLILGLTDPFILPLRMVGVGYRALMEEGKLSLKIGVSHPVLIDIPTGIKVAIPAPQRIILSSSNYPALTLFAAQIREWRKPEPYNQKGIFVGDETIKKKEGKKR